MKDLFGADVVQKDITLSIYCDERRIEGRQCKHGENWIYISLLIVPDSKKAGAFNSLMSGRKTACYDNEIEFANLRKPSSKSEMTALAKLWLQQVLNDNDKRFYFKVLGIKKDNLLGKYPFIPRKQFSNLI